MDALGQVRNRFMNIINAGTIIKVKFYLVVYCNKANLKEVKKYDKKMYCLN